LQQTEDVDQRMLLGEPDAGVIREGSPADLVLLHGDPYSDPASLWRVWRITSTAYAPTDQGSRQPATGVLPDRDGQMQTTPLKCVLQILTAEYAPSGIG
jgi:hypothetical protein